MSQHRPARIALLASGDFACNLYWQSQTFFLLFFYTDVLRLSPALAGVILFVGSVWDGLADFATGLWVEGGTRSYRWYIGAGALPLGLTFVLLYAPLPFQGWPLAVALLAIHVAFRSCYAMVNIPFAALSARMRAEGSERSLFAGLRMFFGTAAATTVPVVTGWLAWRMGPGAASYTFAAGLFAVLGTANLFLVAWQTRSIGAATMRVAGGPALGRRLALVLRNRAFLTLNLAMAVVAVGATVLTRSVLYYFTYVAEAPASGPATLALLGLVGVLVLPLWMAIGRWRGLRWAWFAAAGLAGAVLVAFALWHDRSILGAQLFVMAMQAAFTGFNLAFWSLLPDSVDYGERQSGQRVEALAFGVSALFQKWALGLAAGVMGLGYELVGYVANAPQSQATLEGMQGIMLLVPGIAMALSALAMWANPLRRTRDGAG